jgi:hypothetical protein
MISMKELRDRLKYLLPYHRCNKYVALECKIISERLEVLKNRIERKYNPIWEEPILKICLFNLIVTSLFYIIVMQFITH